MCEPWGGAESKAKQSVSQTFRNPAASGVFCTVDLITKLQVMLAYTQEIVGVTQGMVCTCR